MGYVKESELRLRAQRLVEGHVKLAKSLRFDTNVFLSHARADEELLNGAIGMLIDIGATPYVDREDHELNALRTNQRKAALLRSRINRCGRLVLLLTEHSIGSHWTPWEVGVADGLHGINRVATLPIKQIRGSDEWGLREYLANYPQIREVTLKGDREPSKIVLDPGDGLYWRFKQWLVL
jgi:hypothetical protein